ncbi:hypothetical protein J6590_102648, partial [Homalodisca vitripennis]
MDAALLWKWRISQKYSLGPHAQSELLMGHLDGVIIHLGGKEWRQSRAVQTNPEHDTDSDLSSER